MWKRLIAGLILTSSVFNGLPGQDPDGYDTLFCRSDTFMLVPKFDTLKQLEKANEKADRIIESLQEIAKELGIKDTIQ